MIFEGKKIQPLFNSGLLLAPGFFYALLSLLLSSNRVLPGKEVATLFLLNATQLLSFGVTIAKYAADQTILARLSGGQKAGIHQFFVRRVIPISFFFSLVIGFVNSYSLACMLLICIPIEVYVIIVIVELNIAGKFLHASFLSIIGYPLVFICYTLFSLFFKLENWTLLFLFLSASFVKLAFSFYMRNKGENKNDIMILSGYVPLQQTGNYLLFKADQVIIANNLISSAAFNFSLPSDYLFYAKFIEVYSGIATSLAPLIVKYSAGESGEFSIVKFFKNKVYVSLCLLSVFLQVLVSVLFFKHPDTLHLLLLLPFCIITILIVPVNIINYNFYRNRNLKVSIAGNLICFVSSIFLALVNLHFKSVLIFAFIVPLQLLIFVLINTNSKAKSDV